MSAARSCTSTASSTRFTGGRSSSYAITCCAWANSFGGYGGTTSVTRTVIGAGSQMKLTCSKRPRITVTRAPGTAAAASEVELPTSVSGLSTHAVSSGPASSRASTTGENSGSRLALRTATSAVSPRDRSAR